MDSLLALLPVPAYAAVIAAIAVLANRVLADDGTAVTALFRIELDPPGSRDVQEDEPLRWNVDRLRRPTRSESAPSATSMPTGAVGGLEGAPLP